MILACKNKNATIGKEVHYLLLYSSYYSNENQIYYN